MSESVSISELAAALAELADDLEAEINGRYLDSNVHPALARRYDRDMQPVRNARALLARIEGCEP